jgi:predicted methyltransferase
MVGWSALLFAACAAGPTPGLQTSQSNNAWTTKALSAELANLSRPQADRDRDADRKPAQLMTFFGVQRGMTAADFLAGGGFMTEVLSVTVGSNGKVYSYDQGVNTILDKRLADSRLPNVVRTDGSRVSIPKNSLDAAIIVMNLHDIYNASGSQATLGVLKSGYDLFKPDAVLGVVDHVGVPGADNAKLHRMTKQQAIDVVTAAGFVLESESDVLAHSSDDHTKLVTDPSVRGKTDQFTLKFRKPK